MIRALLPTAIIMTLLGGCSFIPDYQRPAAAMPAAWPTSVAYEVASDQAGEKVTPYLGWKAFFLDPALLHLIQMSLDNNRDLKVAALNVEAFQARYRIQRAELMPVISAEANGTRQRRPASAGANGVASSTNDVSATLGTNAWEMDFFGRVRSLNEESLQQYFATEQAWRSSRISLVSSVATAYLTWKADEALLHLTQDTLSAYEESYRLTKLSFDVGTTDALSLSQARTSVEGAQVNLAAYARLVAQDLNSLAQLLGTAIPADLINGLRLRDQLFVEVPPGLPSDLLEQRPDILEAEHQLRAANANIGAARAAFFPSITLTANAGAASDELSGLWGGASGVWLFQPSIRLPIFTAGSLQSTLDYSEIQKDIGIARYEQAIKVAFREVADGLAARTTYKEQLGSQRALVGTTEEYYRLAERRYRSGVDSYLVLLDAQRQLYTSRQQLISVRLNQLSSEVSLYKSLGGGASQTQHLARAVAN